MGCLGKPPKQIKNQRLALEIECVNVAGSAIELPPDIGDLVEGCALLRAVVQARCQPPVHGLYEGRELRLIGTIEVVAQCVERIGLNRWKTLQECPNTVAQVERIAVKKLKRAPHASFRNRSRSRSRNLRVRLGSPACGCHSPRHVCCGKFPHPDKAATRTDGG